MSEVRAHALGLSVAACVAETLANTYAELDGKTALLQLATLLRNAADATLFPQPPQALIVEPPHDFLHPPNVL